MWSSSVRMWNMTAMWYREKNVRCAYVRRLNHVADGQVIFPRPGVWVSILNCLIDFDEIWYWAKHFCVYCVSFWSAPVECRQCCGSANADFCILRIWRLFFFFSGVKNVRDVKLDHSYSEIIPTRCNNCVYSSQWLYSTCFG